jgi:hypothetical protein
MDPGAKGTDPQMQVKNSPNRKVALKQVQQKSSDVEQKTDHKI